jgi:hypothetical protein
VETQRIFARLGFIRFCGVGGGGAPTTGPPVDNIAVVPDDPYIEPDPRRRWPNAVACAGLGAACIVGGAMLIGPVRWIGVALFLTGLVVGFGGLLLGFIVDLVHWARWRRVRGREELGQCIGCGYDLTGNRSGVCPECGRDTG